VSKHKRVSFSTRFKRYAKQSVRKLSERLNRMVPHRLPLEPVDGWPAPYDTDTPEATYAFISLLRTWNEANSQVDFFFGKKDYFKDLATEWRTCRNSGQRMVIEKCRRMGISYQLGALELHDLGLKRQNHLITHLTNDDAGRELWRIWQMYTDLAERFPMWKLPPLKTYGSEAAQLLDQLIFGNGSVVDKHFENPKGLRGHGYTMMRIEELGHMQYPDALWAQANVLTMGEAGTSSGSFVCAVSNASPNQLWQAIKRGGVPR
jgi:hypothetical protein